MRSLRARITLVTVLVAVIAVVVTALISLQLVRSSTTEDARTQLAAQAELLAKLPRIASVAELSDRASLALGDTRVALVAVDGSVSGPAASWVSAAVLVRLSAAGTVSTTTKGDGGLAIVEARTTRDGSAIVLARPLSSVEAGLRSSTWRIVLSLGIGLAFAVIGGTLLARRLSRPLAEAAVAAGRLAHGERGVPLPTGGPTEVAEVTDALATLDAALASSEGRQREFLLSISHELRTPITAVRGYAEALADGLIAPDKVAGVGTTLVAETERLDHFVTDLLELARLEADDFTIAAAPADVATILTEAADAWRGRATTLGVTLAVAAEPATLNTDARRLRQVIDGLVENALRVSPEGSTVTLRLTSGASGASLAVADGGPGLAADDLAVAFDRGVLRARYRDIRPVGTGLGLSIAARLVSRLGGTIAAANNIESAGAVFTVTLPGHS